MARKKDKNQEEEKKAISSFFTNLAQATWEDEWPAPLKSVGQFINSQLLSESLSPSSFLSRLSEVWLEETIAQSLSLRASKEDSSRREEARERLLSFFVGFSSLLEKLGKYLGENLDQTILLETISFQQNLCREHYDLVVKFFFRKPDRLLSLKQIPAAEAAISNVFQALVMLSVENKKLHHFKPVDEEILVRIHDTPTYPIVRLLGLKTAYASLEKPLRPHRVAQGDLAQFVPSAQSFWGRWTLTLGSGVNVWSRAAGAPEFKHSEDLALHLVETKEPQVLLDLLDEVTPFLLTAGRRDYAKWKDDDDPCPICSVLESASATDENSSPENQPEEEQAEPQAGGASSE